VLTAETLKTISELKISLLVLLLSMDMIPNHYKESKWHCQRRKYMLH